MNMQAPPAEPGFAPPALRTLADTGLTPVMMRDILLKTIFRKNVEQASDIAKAICLPIPLTTQLIDMLRDMNFLQATGTMHATSSSEMGFQLTDAGKARALDALSQSEYYGAMPVPLEDYKVQVKRQSIRDIKLTRPMLEASMGHLILPDGLIDQLGPAVGSGRSVLMYGPPGNGKSSIAEGIRAAMGDNIYIPHALSYAGQVITLFDPIVHTPVTAATETEGQSPLRKNAARFDTRYLLCTRPTVMTGGELKLSMLDLNYNAVSRTYQASMQLKSTGGVFIVDDLGRQAEPPQTLINRWIVPMEVNYDILALQSGEKFEVPFDTLVVFSTNFHPNEIFDQAALRRIFFKVKIDGPNQEQFLKIFAMVAKKKGIPLDEKSLIHMLKVRYPTIDNVYANYHPVFLCDQIKAICDFEGQPYHMTPEYIDRAWENLYVREETIVH
ncbi:ATPase [Jannaschia sp. EhC01]|uniref:ATPase n=1 Tax=Gymnodinialimonas phycosphaerae TaxID=2841589 RepID=A0A975YFQ8_9RHOB|nr:ATPase [Gymnodinialimonas phycosphaerae]MBY4895030.1 ATPase [Gymnodinialimonas phycosphaerae]OAN84375.1 ATPase [Jannaschia sp. EhC01]